MELHKLGIIQHVMEADLTLLLVCMSAVQQYCKQGGFRPKHQCGERSTRWFQFALVKLWAQRPWTEFESEVCSFLWLNACGGCVVGQLIHIFPFHCSRAKNRVCIKLLMIIRWWCMWRHCITGFVLTMREIFVFLHTPIPTPPVMLHRKPPPLLWSVDSFL